MSHQNEKLICEAFAVQLSDSHVEVKANAVKNIQKISNRIAEVNCLMIMQTLANGMKPPTDAQEEGTIEIFSLTIRSIIEESDEQ